MSPALAERGGVTPRLRRDSPPEASRTFFRARFTRMTPCLISSSDSAAGMPAFTSALVALTEPDLFLLCNLCSASSRGFPDVAAQAVNFLIILNDGPQVTYGTSCSTPVRLHSSLFSASSFLEHSADR